MVMKYNMSKQHDIFLSYSRRNIKAMQKLRDALRSHDIKVWTDDYLESGTPVWEHSIEQAIRDSRSLLVLLSPDSSASKWVRSEIRMADDLELIIFPVLIAGDESISVPLGIYASQWIDARNNFDKQLDTLVSAVQKKLNIKSRLQLEAEILNLEAQLESTHKQFARERAQLLLQIENTQTNSADKSVTQTLLDETTKQYADALQQIEQLKNELTIAQANTSSLDTNVAQKKITELEKDLRSYKSRPTQATVKELRNENKELKAKAEQLDKDKFTLTKENESLKTQAKSKSTPPPLGERLTFSWSFSLIAAILTLLVMQSPNLDSLVAEFGGTLWGVAPQTFGISALIILGFNFLFGSYNSEDEIIFWFLGILIIIIWVILLIGLLPDSLLGIVSLILIFLALIPLVLVGKFSDISATIWISILIALILVFFIGTYGVLNEYFLNYLDGFWLLAASVASTIFAAIILAVIILFVIGTASEAGDFAIKTISFLTVIVSFGLFVWIYQFGAWEFFVASV